MTISQLLERLRANPASIGFQEVIAVIDSHYQFQPVEFRNGDLINGAGQNNGSCRIFSFSKLHQLSEQETLHCFGDYYRVDVLQHPDGNDHQNIRNFMKTGWAGVMFEGEALTDRKAD